MADDSKNIVTAKESQGDIILYTNEDGSVKLDVQIEGDTVWLTKGQMALLFGRDRTVIGRHIANIYKEGELQKDITCAKFAHMGKEGDQEYNLEYYNLDVIISVGYRVHSIQGVRFRQWVLPFESLRIDLAQDKRKVLREFIVKGFALDDERLKQLGGGGYWKELLVA